MTTIEYQIHLIRGTSKYFSAIPKFDQIDWRKDKLGSKGARGTGKTLLILQFLKRAREESICGLLFF